MTYQLPTIQTTIFVSLFLVIYLIYLMRKAIKNDIDLYDLLLLSTVAIIPTIFVFFPKLVIKFASLIGVGIPFVILFGILFLIIFIALYQLILRVNHNHKMIVLLIQELSLLKGISRRKEEDLEEE